MPDAFGAKVTQFFLDRAHIAKKIGAAKVKALMRSGGRMRITAQRSMRYRVKGSSAPGAPPFAHKKRGALLRKLLFFFYDQASDSVVVGPVSSRKAEAPGLNEFGGTSKHTAKGKVIVAHYPPRPFMSPALRLEEPKMPKEWANSISGP